MASAYGRSGVSGGAHSGGSNYSSFKAKPSGTSGFLDAGQRGRYEGALGVIKSGGLTVAQTAQFEKRLAKGKTNKAFRTARQGFGRVQEAERDVGLLRDVAASRALGAASNAASKLSKPWKMRTQSTALLTSETLPTFSPKGLTEGVKPGGKVGAQLQAKYQEGSGTQAQQNIASLVRGSGTYGQLTADSYTGAGSYGAAVAKKKEISGMAGSSVESYLEQRKYRRNLGGPHWWQKEAHYGS